MKHGMGEGWVLEDPHLHTEGEECCSYLRVPWYSWFSLYCYFHKVGPKGSVECGYVSICITNFDIRYIHTFVCMYEF